MKSIDKITHDVLQIVTEKPPGYTFIPGQATDVSINNKDWKEEKGPFTFTCLPHNDYIGFAIKTYPSHQAQGSFPVPPLLLLFYFSNYSISNRQTPDWGPVPTESVASGQWLGKNIKRTFIYFHTGSWYIHYVAYI